ncbi:MAG: RNA polymerase sigma factor [Actinomycetota bacterium]|nr:RNA polymerase sigma factor [Actinomycetota bacterium]
MASEGTPGGIADRALVIAFQSGDEHAYEEIFKRYHARVLAVCSRMLRTPQDAEEATQETFLRAYVALPRFNGSFYLGAWLSRIATNVCVDHIRSRSRSNLVALPDDQDELATEQGPEEIVVGAYPRLQKAIQDIQPLHASALALRTLEGYSHEEIAGHLRMTPSQVKALLHRARMSLRRAWDKAEGWALAPLLGVRHLMNDRITADAGRVASLSPSAAPFIAERVAAVSAIIVAAALTGVPSAPEVDPAPERPVASSPNIAAPSEHSVDWSSAATHSSQVRERVAPAQAADPAPAPAADVVKTATDLVAEIRRNASNRRGGEGPDYREEQDEDGSVGPGAAEGDKVVRKVKSTVQEIQETVAP